MQEDPVKFRQNVRRNERESSKGKKKHARRSSKDEEKKQIQEDPVKMRRRKQIQEDPVKVRKKVQTKYLCIFKIFTSVMGRMGSEKYRDFFFILHNPVFLYTPSHSLLWYWSVPTIKKKFFLCPPIASYHFHTHLFEKET